MEIEERIEKLENSFRRLCYLLKNTFPELNNQEAAQAKKKGDDKE